MAKVIFLRLSVILFKGGVCWDTNPPPDQTDSPPDQTPPRPGRPPGSDTIPPDQADPPGPGRPPRIRHHPAPDQADTTPPPPDQADTPPPRDQADSPPPGSRLQHAVYERPVRILLECILVSLINLCIVGPFSFKKIILAPQYYNPCVGISLHLYQLEHSHISFTGIWTFGLIWVYEYYVSEDMKFVVHPPVLHLLFLYSLSVTYLDIQPRTPPWFSRGCTRCVLAPPSTVYSPGSAQSSARGNRAPKAPKRRKEKRACEKFNTSGVSCTI